MPVISQTNINARPSRRKLAFSPSAGIHASRESTVWPANTSALSDVVAASAAAVTTAAIHAVKRRRPRVLLCPLQRHSSVPGSSGSSTVSGRAFMGLEAGGASPTWHCRNHAAQAPALHHAEGTQADHAKARVATAVIAAMHTRFSTRPQRIMVACGTRSVA